MIDDLLVPLEPVTCWEVAMCDENEQDLNAEHGENTDEEMDVDDNDPAP